LARNNESAPLGQVEIIVSTVKHCSVLISSAGRRVALLQAFRAALTEAGINGSVIAVDMTPLASAFQLADASFLVPPCTDPGFVDAILDICAANGVRLIVPTIDTELPVYAKHRDRFAERGILVNVSAAETISIAADKRATNKFLEQLGAPTVRQESLTNAIANTDDWRFPVIAKPALGSAGTGVRWITNADELRLLGNRPHYVVESIARGHEVTVDVFLVDGRCLLTVPRRRLEVRGGEVSKGMTMRHVGVMSLAAIVAEGLPGGFGALNIQMFHDPGSDSLTVSEINARFGGGFPLSLAAGAKCPNWLIDLALSREPPISNEWVDKLVMLRYDDAVFLSADRAGIV
jgi:carbamoyl-phosphate synthase large subunit